MDGEERKKPNEWIAHIVVVGFHHTLGNHIETVYPPIDQNNAQKEHQWEYLPFLAIPDGSHNSKDDFTFFVLPKTGGEHDLYGVSCFRQIRAQDLPEEARTSDITRTYVQKAVCILSYLPFFGPFYQRLSVITQYYFEQKNFSNTEILVSFYSSLASSYSPEKSLSIPDLLVGVDLQDLVLKLGRKLLILFKLIFLEKGIIIFSTQPVHQACTLSLSLLSLFPSGFDCVFPSFINNETLESSIYHDPQHSTYGLPLKVFHRNCMFYPFVTLQQMDILNKKGVGFLAGTSNMLYVKHPPYSTAAILEAGTGNVTFPNEAFNRIVSLSSSDRRFIDDIITTVTRARSNQSPLEESGNSITWEGSDSWIRAQFSKYTHCLLNAAAKIPHIIDPTAPEDLDLGGLDAYHVPWARAWTGTYNFRKWRQQITPNIELLLASAADLPVHPSGPPTALLDDISDKLSNQLKELEPTLTPLRQGIGNLTSSTLSTVRENAGPLKTSLTNSSSLLLSNVRSNALSFSKFLTDSADTFMANYNDERMHSAPGGEDPVVANNNLRNRSNSAVTGNSAALHHQNYKNTRSRSIAVPVVTRINEDKEGEDQNSPSTTTTTTTITPQSKETDATPINPESTQIHDATNSNNDHNSATDPSSGNDVNANTNNNNTTITTNKNTNENANNTENTSNANTTTTPPLVDTNNNNNATTSPRQESKHQDSVAAVAKATARAVSSGGRWFSALSAKLVETVASISEALEEVDDVPPAPSSPTSSSSPSPSSPPQVSTSAQARAMMR